MTNNCTSNPLLFVSRSSYVGLLLIGINKFGFILCNLFLQVKFQTPARTPGGKHVSAQRYEQITEIDENVTESAAVQEQEQKQVLFEITIHAIMGCICSQDLSI